MSIPLGSALGIALVAGSIIAAFALHQFEPTLRRWRARWGRKCPLCGALLVGPLGGRYCPAWLVHLARLEHHRTTLEASIDRHPSNLEPADPFGDWPYHHPGPFDQDGGAL